MKIIKERFFGSSLKDEFFRVKTKGGKDVNRRTCPLCGGRSYSSYSGPNWDCPYCGKGLGNVPDELSDIPRDSLEEDTPTIKLYAINGGKSAKEKHVENA